MTMYSGNRWTKRNMKRNSRFLLLLALCVAVSTVYAWESVDRIIAVVGDKVITGSELDFQLQLYQVQTGTKVSDADDAHKLKEQILTQMINDRLILIKATQDTTIRIVDDEVDEALNSRMDELKSRFPTQEQFEKQVVSEGFTMRELKAKLREEAREQLLKQKLIGKLLSKVSVGKSEVEKFYETYKDSIPPHPQQVKLAHLLLEVTSSKSTSDSLVNLARSLIERINQGDSFETLAQQYSQDVSAPSGGEIGTVRKGDLMPEFEKAALALSPGGVSDVVKTSVGYHIIKLMARSEDQYEVKHILLLNKPTAADSAAVMTLAIQLLDRIKKGEDFGALVKEYSADSTSSSNFGELGWLPIENLPDEFKTTVGNLANGQVSDPIWSTDGLHLLKTLDHKESRPVSLAEDWDGLKEMTRRQKSELVIASVVNEMKDKVYLEVRDF
jgi:peptidyl-prolyl cis-trans isomerase SurA